MNFRRRTAIFLAICMLTSCAAGKNCADSSETDEPQFVDDIPTENYVEASVEDAIKVLLYVYTSEYLYLYSDTPIEVYAPGNSPFKFEQDIYKLNPNSLIFPIVIDITVPRGVKPGEEYTILLPMRLRYKKKANDELLTRTDLVKVPVNIIERKLDRRRTRRFSVEYVLD